MPDLHLTLKRRWFDLIAHGHKKIEYRLYKPYWIQRLTNPDGSIRVFDKVHFKNGYAKKAPWMRVKFIKTEIAKNIQFPETEDTADCFLIHLGKVLEIKNWKNTL
ncbi:MAG: ASCH domain-containing protein [Patescibacteria group bacterium]